MTTTTEIKFIMYKLCQELQKKKYLNDPTEERKEGKEPRKNQNEYKV